MAMVLGIPVMVYIVFVSVCVYWSREREGDYISVDLNATVRLLLHIAVGANRGIKEIQ